MHAPGNKSQVPISQIKYVKKEKSIVYRDPLRLLEPLSTLKLKASFRLCHLSNHFVPARPLISLYQRIFGLPLQFPNSFSNIAHFDSLADPFASFTVSQRNTYQFSFHCSLDHQCRINTGFSPISKYRQNTLYVLFLGKFCLCNINYFKLTNWIKKI